MESIKRKNWTESEISILETYYSSKGLDYCTSLLQPRTKASIKQKALKLGLKNGRYWNEKDLETLKNYYSLIGPTECQKLMPHRGYAAIVNKASELRLKPKPRAKTNAIYDQELFDIESDAFRLEDYKGDKVKILHTCSHKHTWMAAPNSILKGRGCPYCAQPGLDLTKSGVLYFVQIDNSSLYKIGVTTSTLQERFKQDYSRINVLKIRTFDPIKEGFELEQDILYRYDQYRVTVPNLLKNGGNTELFNRNIMSPEIGLIF